VDECKPLIVGGLLIDHATGVVVGATAVARPGPSHHFSPATVSHLSLEPMLFGIIGGIMIADQSSLLLHTNTHSHA
jgi:hypothetical protein